MSNPFGAFDLFAGQNSISGTDLFSLDKNPLDQLSLGQGFLDDEIAGIEKAIDESIQNIPKFIEAFLYFLGEILEQIIDSVLQFFGLPPLPPGIVKLVISEILNIPIIIFQALLNILGLSGVSLTEAAEIMGVALTKPLLFFEFILNGLGLDPSLDDPNSFLQFLLNIADAVLGGTIEAVTDFTNSLLTGLGLGPISSFAGNAVAQLLQYLNPSGQFLATQLIGEINNTVTFGGTELATLFQYINNVGQYDASQLFGALNTGLTFAGTALHILLQYLTSGGLFDAGHITGALNGLVTLSGTTLDVLLQYLDNVGQFDAGQLTGALSSAITFGGTALSTFFQYIDSSGQFLANGITGALTSAATVGGTSITTLLQYIGLGGAFDAAHVVGSLNSAITFGGTALSTFFQNIDSSGQLIASGITGALNTAVTIFGTAISTLLQFLNGSGLYNAGAGFANQGTSLLQFLTPSGGGIGQFDAAHIVGALNNAITYGGTALSTFFQNINGSGGLLASGLTGAINTAVTISGNALSSLFNGSGVLASALTGALNSAVTFGGTALSTVLQYITPSSGVFDAAHIAGALNSALTFGGTALSVLFQYLNSSGQFDAGQITGAVNTAITISGNAISSLFSASGVLGSAISGVTAIEQSLINTAVGAGNAGFPFTFPISFGAVANDITDVGAAILDASHSGQDVLNTIVQAITGVQSNVNHSLQDLSTAIAQLPATLPVAVTAIADTGVHTATTTASQIVSLVTNSLTADAAAAGAALANAGTNINTIIAGVQGTVAADVSTAITTAQATGQSTINNIFNAVNATNTVVNQAVASVQTGLSGFFTGLFNGWTGQSWSTASVADVIQTAAPAAKTITDTHTVNIASITAKLPAFYGGGGAGGLNESVSMSGTLPAGFSTASTIAVASAIYNTVATTDTQTVAGSWSVADTHAQYLFLRANAGFTTYSYAKIQANAPFTGVGNCEIGCVVSGVRHVFSTFALPGSFTASTTYSFAAVGTTLTLSGPGGLNAVYTDSGPVSQVGSSYRYGGFGTDGYSREIDSWSAAGSTTYTPPAWMQSTDTFDFVEVGGGGGGAGGVAGGHDSFTQSYGGSAGAWTAATVSKSTVTGSFTVTVGAAGTAGPQGNQSAATAGGPGGAGGSSSVTATGYGTLTCSGGAGGAVAPLTRGSAPTYGAGPGNGVWNNAGYVGGATATLVGPGQAGYPGVGYPGNPPGGGGVGGWNNDFGIAQAGGSGAAGEVWITANDRSCPGSLGFWAFYDAAISGPVSVFTGAQETTTSGGFTDLATTSDFATVNVGTSGTVLVFICCGMYNSTTNNVQTIMSFAGSGANTWAAQDYLGLSIQQPAGSVYMKAGNTQLLTGLTPGATTFKLKYRVNGGTGAYDSRMIQIVPL